MSKLVEPDLEFIRYVKKAGGDTLKKCYQCATCSVVCPLSQDKKPFPRREMLLAQWGMKDELLSDANVMLCHQCGDCNTYCPRDAKPGNVLGAIRAYAYTHYGFPQGLARMVSDSKNLPLIIGLPAALVLFVWYLSGGMHLPKGAIDFGQFFGEGHFLGFTKTVLIIDALMLPAFLFAIFAAYKGVSAMWCKMSTQVDGGGAFRPSVVQFVTDFLWPSVTEIVQHTRFKKCTTNAARATGHMPLVLAFIGLFIVTNYGFVRKDIFGMFNPALHGPLSLMDPFKILANISAVAMIVGIFILWSNRKKDEAATGAAATFYDWFLIYEIAAVGITGIAAEITRLAGMVVPAYLSYYLHLVSVFMLFLYMPYTKFAHMVYRTFAMAFEKYRESNFVKID